MTTYKGMVIQYRLYLIVVFHRELKVSHQQHWQDALLSEITGGKLKRHFSVDDISAQHARI